MSAVCLLSDMFFMFHQSSGPSLCSGLSGIAHCFVYRKKGQSTIDHPPPLFNGGGILQKCALNFGRHGLLVLSFSCLFWIKLR